MSDTNDIYKEYEKLSKLWPWNLIMSSLVVDDKATKRDTLTKEMRENYKKSALNNLIHVNALTFMNSYDNVLTDFEKEVVLNHFKDGLSFKQVAGKHNKTVNHIRNVNDNAKRKTYGCIIPKCEMADDHESLESVYMDRYSNKIRVQELGLDNRITNVLLRGGKNFLSDLEDMTLGDFFRLRGIGETTLLEIFEAYKNRRHMRLKAQIEYEQGKVQK